MDQHHRHQLLGPPANPSPPVRMQGRQQQAKIEGSHAFEKTGLEVLLLEAKTMSDSPVEKRDPEYRLHLLKLTLRFKSLIDLPHGLTQQSGRLERSPVRAFSLNQLQDASVIKMELSDPISRLNDRRILAYDGLSSVLFKHYAAHAKVCRSGSTKP